MSPIPAPKKILVVDDEAQIRRLLRVTLEAEGYWVREAESAAEGLREAAVQPPDGVILDMGLPDMDGREAIKRLRSWSQVPVLILSVRDAEDEKIAALDAGADDYLTKPFAGGELLARVRAVLRRSQPSAEPSLVRFGDVEFDRAERTVRRNGQRVHLTVREYDLLALLVRYRGRVVTHRQILRDLWGPHAEEQTQYLRVHMAHLRRKLESEVGSPKHLKTEAGIGYRLVD